MLLIQLQLTLSSPSTVVSENKNLSAFQTKFDEKPY